MGNTDTGLLDEVLDAHGGAERWAAARRIRSRVRSGGLLIRTRVPGNRFADYEVTVEPAERRAVLDPFPKDGLRGVFDSGEARIEAEDGAVIESRANPRAAFSGGSGLRRNLRWDALDSTYFAGYAMWNYLTTPYLLTREAVEAREGEAPPRLRRRGGWRLGARRPLLRRAHRVRWAEVPHPPLGTPDRATKPLDAIPDDGVARARRRQAA